MVSSLSSLSSLLRCSRHQSLSVTETFFAAPAAAPLGLSGAARQSVVKSGAECQPMYFQSFRELPPAAVYISVHNS